MPPANQSSKAALITWTVVATVFGISMAVLALVAYAGRNDAELRAEKMRTSYASVASEADLNTSRVSDLKNAAGTSNVLQYMLQREEELANKTAGSPDAIAASAAVTAKLDQVNQRAADNITAANLVSAVDQLGAKVDSLKQENATLTRTLTEAQQGLQSAQQQALQQVAAARAEADQARKAQADAVASVSQIDENKQGLVTEVNSTMSQLADGFSQSIQEQERRAQDLEEQLSQTRTNLQRLKDSRQLRVEGGQLITSPDGKVVRSPSGGTLYINLGSNDSITTGMTFQVYDAVRGIPQMQNETDLPRGKGSIQVLRIVSGTSAECRVIENTPGQPIREGDLIANLAYDKNVPVTFRVYGDFDLDNNGKTDPRDRERLNSLVQQFGGKLVDDITVTTDVVVLGREPVVPTLSAEEERDSAMISQRYQAQAQLDAYNATLKRAQEFNIPVLNQNQFLYYIGYFEQIRR